MRRGAAYTLDDGLRLWDHDSGCGKCGKRAAEVLHDPSGQWVAGTLVCIDCGTAAPAYAEPLRYFLAGSWRGQQQHVAVCQLCRYKTSPSTLANATAWALQHLERVHSESAA